MSLIDIGAEDTLRAALPYQPPPRPAPKFSAWSAIPRGLARAATEVGASVAEVVGGFGQVAGAYPEALGVVALTEPQRAQAEDARRRLLTDGVEMNNPVGDAMRGAGRALQSDPATASTADQLLFGFARAAAKVVGGALAAGPAGVIAAGAEEANTVADDLARQGVPFEARAPAAVVQGGGLALAALPVVGQSLRATAALYVAGGPGAFVAQQALTREILQQAGHDRVAAQYDPFDPVGLAVASLVPAAFAAYGIRAQRRAALPQDAADAAMVSHLAERDAAHASEPPAPIQPPRNDPPPPTAPEPKPEEVRAALRQRLQPIEEADAAVAAEMQRVRAEAQEGTAAELGRVDADLLRVAAECALSLA